MPLSKWYITSMTKSNWEVVGVGLVAEVGQARKDNYFYRRLTSL
jgi:hypothetical protein